MPIVNNDHYLGYCLIANTAANIIGTLLWGWIGDLKGINMSMIFVCLANLLAASIGFFSKDAIMLMVFMIFMGFADRGMETIAGPGLVEIYCLKVASKLMPFKAVSLLLGFVIAPLIQISTTSILTPFNFLRCLYFFPILSFLISLFYYRTYNNSSKPLLVK